MSTATGLFDPAGVAADVRAAFDRYEQALVAGDVPTLTELFWADPRCVRFGVADRQQGGAAIAAWRAAHPSVPPGRRLWDTRVLAVDDRTAVVTTLFDYPERAVEGRQSQTWVRFADGWRVVAAHVSEVPRGSGAATGPERGAAAASGLARGGPAASRLARGTPVAAPTVRIAVVAAHRTGQPLHPELVALGGRSVGVARTAPAYRLVALPGPGVPRGGLVAVGAGGHAIEVELHEMPTAEVGSLLAGLPAPLALGSIRLGDGDVLGMVCTTAPAGTVDVSAWGSWPAYLAAVETGAMSG